MYGWKTKSWNNSTEHSQMKQECSEITRRYKAGELHFNCALPQVCHCLSFHFPHSLEKHKELRADCDWRTPEQRGV
jgi:hypothetical protein